MAETRRLHGREMYSQPSRFLSEIPADLLREIRPRSGVSQPVWRSAPEPAQGTGLRLGQRVTHVKFGEGIIMNAEGQGEQARVQVNFADAGPKWLVVAYANLQAI